MPSTIAPGGKSTGVARSSDPGKQTFFDRWLKTWAILLGLVVLVVVAYLIAITSSLSSINKNLGVASDSVTGAGGNVLTLPDQIQRANENLTGIDTALKPIDAETDRIISALTSIRGGLTSIDGSLKNTNGSLVDTDSSLKNTNGSLTDTDNVLGSVLGLAGKIRTTLVDADDPPDKLGVQNIHRRVDTANKILTSARADTKNILTSLVQVNVHLESICNSPAVRGGPSCNA
ncbi:MAG: hypothetical protein WD794_14345 [Mycobacteriales bacterium]